MSWDPTGAGVCDTCRREGPHNVQVLRALGWHHSSGETMGGQPYEALLCPSCAKDEHRRKRTPQLIDQDALPFDWGQCAATPQSQGGHTR